MKTTKLFAAALALLSVLSCQKEEQQVIDNSENESGVLITCTFANNDAATRTTVGTDGLTPLWAEGDEIMLYDGSSKTQKLTLALSGTASSTEGIIDGKDATKFTFAKPSGWTKVYAIYPSSACVSGFSASDPKLNFAGQDGTFGKANICAAVEVSGTMTFKNVGAILKFTSKSVKAAKVVVPAAGLANNFKVSFDGANPSLASETASNSQEISIGSGSGAVYIGVPAGNIAASSKFTYKTSAGAELGNYITGADNTVKINEIYNLGAMMGVLSGLFSVDASGNKVQFSKGNLYYNGNTWYFEDNQYDYRTYSEKSSCIAGIKSDTGTPAEHWGTFGWSTSTNYGMDVSTSYSSYYGEFKNWGENSIVNGGNTKIQWSTLSGGEGGNWQYLLDTRKVTVSGEDQISYGLGSVNGVKGLIILPDNWDGSVCRIFEYGMSEYSNEFTESSIPKWSEMESAGCVFLPSAGGRDGSLLYDVGNIGYYWTSTFNNSNSAYELKFVNNFMFSTVNATYRRFGSSVRLVCAAQ